MAGDAGSGSRYIYQKHRLEVLEAAVASLPQIDDDTASIVAIGITLDVSKGFGKHKARYADYARDVLVIYHAGTKALEQLGSNADLQQVAELANKLIDSQPWGRPAGFLRSRHAVDRQVGRLSRVWDARAMDRIKAEVGHRRVDGQDVETDARLAE